MKCNCIKKGNKEVLSFTHLKKEIGIRYLLTQSIITALFIVVCNINTLASDVLVWKFKTNGKIYGGGKTDNSNVYFGSSDSCIYAVSISNGTEIWQFRTGCGITSTPIINDTAVFISAGDILYAINKKSGYQYWKYMPSQLNSQKPVYMKDDFDYHQASPLLYNNDIFNSDAFGNVYGLDVATGKIAHQFTSKDKAPVRSGVTIKADTLFYGDWNGYIYAVRLTTNKELWSTKLTDSLPYPAFGAIVTPIVVYQNKLFFGVRNPEFKVISADNGKTLWKYKATNDGWMMGDPIINNDTLYIGGSDNKAMLAFNPNNGTIYWENNALYQISSKPGITKDILIFGDGDSYNNHKGKGNLYFVNKKNGRNINIWTTGRNIYSPVAIKDSLAMVGCSDSYFYCININSILSATSSMNSVVK